MTPNSKKVEYSISLNNKKYSYILTKVNNNITHISCPAAWIDQDFDNEDIPDFLMDLPDLILETEEDKKKEKSEVEILRLRVSKHEKLEIKKLSLKNGYKNVSSYIRDLALQKK